MNLITGAAQTAALLVYTMKTLLTGLAVLIITPLTLIGGFKDLPKAINKADNCTVLIKSDDVSKTPIGSGVTIVRGNEYYVWTDAHVAECAGKDENGKWKQLRAHRKIIKDGEEVASVETICDILVIEDSIDIALLKVKEGGTRKFFKNTKFYLDDKVLPKGTDVLLNGHFLSFPGTTPGFTGSLPANIGGFKHIMKDSSQELDIIHNGGVVGGCSGSGVWLEDGRCIGLVCRKYSTNEVLYNPIRIIKKWAKEKDLLWALDETVSKPVDK